MTKFNPPNPNSIQYKKTETDVFVESLLNNANNGEISDSDGLNDSGNTSNSILADAVKTAENAKKPRIIKTPAHKSGKHFDPEEQRTKRILVLLTQQLHKDLEVYAASQLTSTNNMIFKIISEYMNKDDVRNSLDYYRKNVLKEENESDE